MVCNPTVSPAPTPTTGPIQELSKAVRDTVAQFLASPRTYVQTMDTTSGILSISLLPYLTRTQDVPSAGYRVESWHHISAEVYLSLVDSGSEDDSAWITLPQGDLRLPLTRDYCVIHATLHGVMHEPQTERFLVFLAPNGNPGSWQPSFGGSTSDPAGVGRSSWEISIDPAYRGPGCRDFVGTIDIPWRYR